MGQQEVYDFLRDKRMINDDGFYSVRDIYDNLKTCNAKNISDSIKKLYLSKFIEKKTFKNIPKYRCRKDMI